MTPLMYASCTGRADIVSVLINAEAEVDAADKKGRTALHYAAYCGGFIFFHAWFSFLHFLSSHLLSFYFLPVCIAFLHSFTSFLPSFLPSLYMTFLLFFPRQGYDVVIDLLRTMGNAEVLEDLSGHNPQAMAYFACLDTRPRPGSVHDRVIKILNDPSTCNKFVFEKRTVQPRQDEKKGGEGSIVGTSHKSAAGEPCELEQFQQKEVIAWLEQIDKSYPEHVAPLLFDAGYTSIDKLLLNKMNKRKLLKLQDYFENSVGVPPYDAEIVAINAKLLYYNEITRKGYWYRCEPSYIYICVCVCVHVCACIYIYIYICICICTCIYIYIYMYIYIYEISH
jgi:hypothetical protein